MQDKTVSQNQQKGLISVIMACFNAEEYLQEAIESVLNQSYPHIELIVVNDGSTDRSRKILDGYGKHITVIDQRQQGPYPARNKGIEASHGEFIAFLDADDYWRADCLSKLHQVLIGHQAALAYCGWQNVGVSGGRGAPHVPRDREVGDKVANLLRGAAPWPIHAALVRRSVVETVGGFDLDLPTCMDYDLWLRIAATWPVVRVPEVLAFYRHHASGQITSTKWRQAINSWRVKKKFIEDNPQLVAHLPKRELRDLVDGALLRRGYGIFWQGDLLSGQRIFRRVLFTRGWQLKDLRYLLPALLPARIFQWLAGQRND